MEITPKLKYVLIAFIYMCVCACVYEELILPFLTSTITIQKDFYFNPSI